MRAEPNIKLDATVTVVLTEEEAIVLGHLCGYNPEQIVKDITRTYSVEVLERVASGARMQLESATRRIQLARKALNEAPTR